MTRLLAAVLLALGVTAPALACEWHQSVSNDKSSTVASQPSNDQSAPSGTSKTAS